MAWNSGGKTSVKGITFSGRAMLVGECSGEGSSIVFCLREGSGVGSI